MSRRRQKPQPPRAHDPKPITPPSRRHLWAFRLTALLLPVVFLIILEIGLRLAGYGFDPHFFKPLTIDGQKYYVQNEDFSYSFFPREVARNPGALRMLARKPAGTYRIFIFGESAAMGDPEPAYGAARYMEVLLREKYPGAKFEIVNTAFTAINSHVIVPIARESAAYDGDLWIVYMGNNEMVGPFGAATVFGLQAPPLPYVRMVVAIQRTRVGQLFTNLARKFGRHGAPAASWAGMQMFMQNQIAPGNPLRENVYRNFEKNLHDILAAGVGSGAKILLNTVAVNLKDCPPFASLINSNLPAADRGQFNHLLSTAQTAESQGDFKSAAQDYEQANKISADSAELHYHWGKCLLALQSPVPAREQLQLACDKDALPFRTDSRLNDLIAAAPKDFSSGKITLFDAATTLASQTPDHLCGDETFYEHVHFDFDGSYRLGLAWAEQAETLLSPGGQKRSGWLSQAECDQRLGLSDWNRALVTEHMIGRMQVPPLSGQEGNDQRIQRLQARDSATHAFMDTNALVEGRRNFVSQLELYPDDFILHENFGLFLQATGDIPGSIAEWRLVHALLPQDYLADFQLGRLLGRESQWTEGEAMLRLALSIHPGLPEAWVELGNVLVSQNKLQPAMECYQTARQQRPQDAQTVFRMGLLYAKMSQPTPAIEFYRQAIQLNPNDWQMHFELGGALDAAGQLDGARDEFAAAVNLNPGYSRAHFNYGVILAKQGRLDEAQHEFEETLRLEPAYKNAADSLDKIRYLQQHQSIH